MPPKTFVEIKIVSEYLFSLQTAPNLIISLNHSKNGVTTITDTQS